MRDTNRNDNEEGRSERMMVDHRHGHRHRRLRHCWNGNNNVGCCLWWLVVIGLLGGGVVVDVADAMYSDEVGRLDYIVSSGASSNVGQFQTVLLNVNNDNDDDDDYFVSQYDDCTVTRRSMKDGKVKWRRPNVCSPFVSSTSSMIRSWEDNGLIHTWNTSTGDLQSVVAVTATDDDEASTNNVGDKKKKVLSTVEWKSYLVQLTDSQLTVISKSPPPSSSSSDENTTTTNNGVSTTDTAVWTALPNTQLLQMVMTNDDDDDEEGFIHVISAPSNNNNNRMTIHTLKLTTVNDGNDKKYKLVGMEEKVLSFPCMVNQESLVVAPAMTTKKKGIRLAAISTSGKELVLVNYHHHNNAKPTIIPVPSIHPLWHILTSVSIVSSSDSSSSMLELQGQDFRLSQHVFTALYQWDPSSTSSRKLVQISIDGEETTMHLASATSVNNNNVVVYHFYAQYHADQTIALEAFQIHGSNEAIPIPIHGDVTLSSNNTPHSSIHSLHILSSSSNIYQLLVVTSTGTMTKYQLELSPQNKNNNNNQFMSTQQWTQHDALGSIDAALFLDEPTITSSSKEQQQQQPSSYDLSTLTLSHRLYQQYQSFQTTMIHLLFGETTTQKESLSSSSSSLSAIATATIKQQSFGYRKLALLLSSTKHSLLATDTANHGTVLWEYPLNSNAQYHKMIHGSWSTSNFMDHSHLDQQHHHHHVLALSANIPSNNNNNDSSTGMRMTHEYTCFDAHLYDPQTGQVQIVEKGQYYSPSIVQIIPWHLQTPTTTTSCRQASLLLHDNYDISVLPNTPTIRQELTTTLQNHISQGIPYYVHTVDKSTGKFTTLAIVSLPPNNNDNNSGVVAKATVVGETWFEEEQIVSVTYPQRNEVVQSPSTLLGDDSLLLKYLNPHLCVVVTKSLPKKDDNNNNNTPLANALTSRKNQIPKPMGVTPTTETQKPQPSSSSTTTSPNLFINIMDTVSGQILHRVSHVHYDDANINNSQVPVMMSENWIVYAFANARSRRTDLGVLTLHEGMIGKHDITAFTTPDQERTFSSWTSPPPVVLRKLYTVSKPISAIGVTNTRGGITPKHFLLATGINGQIIRLDRRMLDPRRPTGDVKKSEQKEGLTQYVPVIPLTPLWTASYWQEIPYVTSIVSAAANLESQSLILAYGGPDIFFTRLAPSKDFDSLPDSFNHPLLFFIVIGLVGATIMIKGMGETKSISIQWS